MKIAIDARVLMTPHLSGVGLYARELITNLLVQDLSNDYYLFYNSTKDLSFLPSFPRATVIRTHIPNKVLNYAGFKLLGCPSLERLLGFKPDLFLMPHLNFMVTAAGYPKILTVHDLSFLQYPEFFNAKQNLWHWAINTKKLLTSFDQIVAISQSTKEDLITIGQCPAEKITVIPSGVSQAYCQLSDTQALAAARQRLGLPAKFILYLGTIEPRKNIDSLILAYNQLRQQNPTLADVKLVLAGPLGWKCQTVLETASASPYTNDIIFKGYVEANDKIFYYNLASVLAFPSYYEGFGFPPLEAAACGTPVVASFASSLAEVIGGTAYLVDPYDVGQLARGLQIALLDKTWVAQASQRGLGLARDYTWEKTANNYLNLFKLLTK
jgi:glycosyltransferase involved in cell wall biosynthesis